MMVTIGDKEINYGTYGSLLKTVSCLHVGGKSCEGTD